MTDNRITKLLRDYTSALLRLEYDADKPGSKMTLGEYEAEEKIVTDEYAQVIAATLGVTLGGEREIYHRCECCGVFFEVMNVCPNCGRW